MKMQTKKLAAIFLCLCLIFSVLFITSAAENSATISFADKANRTVFNTNQQVWVQNGITVTNNKGASTSNVADYFNPARFYKNSDVTIAYPGMTKIEIDCNNIPAKNTDAWVNSCKDATATKSGSIITITFANAVDSFKIQLTDNQARANSITVYTGEAGGTTPEEPETPENNDPAADSTLTVKEAIDLGASKEHNTYTEGKYYVAGEITEVYNTQYGNMKIKDAEGNILTVYGTYSADGSTRYDKLETKPVAGDTVKVYGIVGQYNGTPQVKNGWIVEHTPATTPEVPPVEPEEPKDPAADSTLTVKDAIALGASREHNVYTAGKYYVAGEITEVYNTTYGNMKIKDAEGNILTVYGTYNADGSARYDAMEVKPVAGDTVKVYGIIGQYNGTPQVKNGWIVEHTPATKPEEPETPVEPEVPNDKKLVKVTKVETGKDYVIVNATTGTVLTNTIETGKHWYDGLGNQKHVLLGGDPTPAADTWGFVYYENGFAIAHPDGGYLSPNTVNVHVADEYTWITPVHVEYNAETDAFQIYREEGSAVYKLVVCNDLSGNFIYAIGCNNTDFDAYSYWNIYEVVDANTTPEEPETPVEPEVPENKDPAADSTLTIKEVIALGASKEHNTYTEGKYYVVGEIKQVYNNVYGNMYLVDAEGNQLTIYGTYSADGSARYDAMDVKPVAGDTVKIYGIVGQYNGTPQIKNGWIVEHTPSDKPQEPEEPVEIPAADSKLTIADALKVGASLDHNVYTEGKYYITGKITEFYGTSGETYGNFYIEDAEGNKILVYGTFAEDGETRYGDMEVKPVIGDTVTVYGPLGQYNGNAQMKNAFFASAPADDDDDNNNQGGVIEDDKDEEENNADVEDDKEEATSPETGDAVTAFAITAAILVATIMAAALLFTNKKKVTE
ncbi:MAG: hypothetical protein IKJ50_00145 [Clostridia bacterium]|nr:hypothetical protein [Clostridia bacterium]